ncbi:MAG: peptide/nickel transport system permease protein, partial [Pseudonocardiales bacterium]|nr:peptide/nickel transport system permease protein [Pseudonocardiales bacterium]
MASDAGAEPAVASAHSAVGAAAPDRDRMARPHLLKPLLQLLAKAFTRALLMLWLVATVTFIAIRALPGNPVDVWVQDLEDTGLSGDQAREKATQLLKIDVNESLWSQYFDYMRNLAHGDL